MNEKLRCLRNKIRTMDLDGMIVSNPVNIKYLTNIEAEGTLILARKENYFITDGRYIEDVNSTLTINDEIIVSDVKDISKEDFENFFLFCENIGFEENYITYAKYKEYMYKYRINNFVETEGLIEKQREIKDEEEIKNSLNEITDDFDIKKLGFDVIPNDMYLVIGDNRTNSLDGRSKKVGLIKKEDIIGKAIVRIWPLNGIKVIK